MQTVKHNITAAIPTTGNVQALSIALTSILSGHVLPGRILIRSEGHFPAFGNFYLEQLSDVARQLGVTFVFAVDKSRGLRGAIDWLLEEAQSRYIWVVADDVMPSAHALACLDVAAGILMSHKDIEASWAWICGNKQDVNNRRGWPDYTQFPRQAADYCPTHGLYEPQGPAAVRNFLLDNSHCLFERERALSVKETQFGYGFQCGGDDTLFGFCMLKAGFTGWFAPHSLAFHLEKEKQNFDEPTARAEAILRQAQLLGISITPEQILAMFPYTRRYGNLERVDHKVSK